MRIIVVAIFLVVMSLFVMAEEQFDIVLKGGRVVDPDRARRHS